MKELSIEEKAKAYDKATKVIKNNLDTLNEITEIGAEDEKIRNEIIAFIEQSVHCGGGTPIPEEQENKWIAWLEKQVSSDMVADAYLIGCNDTERNWIENQNKQKRWKPNEEQVIDLYCYK